MDYLWYDDWYMRLVSWDCPILNPFLGITTIDEKPHDGIFHAGLPEDFRSLGLESGHHPDPLDQLGFFSMVKSDLQNVPCPSLVIAPEIDILISRFTSESSESTSSYGKIPEVLFKLTAVLILRRERMGMIQSITICSYSSHSPLLVLRETHQ